MAWSYVKRNGSGSNSVSKYVTSTTLSPSAGAAAGDLVVLAISIIGAGAPTSVTDSAGNTWVVDDSVAGNATSAGVAIASSVLTNAITTSTVITVNFPRTLTAGTAVWSLDEFSGSGGAAIRDGASPGGSGTSTLGGTPATTTGTTPTPTGTDLCIAAIGQSGGATTPPTITTAGYTSLAAVSNILVVAYNLGVTTAQTVAGTATYGGHGGSWAAVATLYGGTSLAPTNTVAPAVTGTPSVGATLSCSTGTWTGTPTYAYQWKRNGANIADATASTYTLVTADQAATITCIVTATQSGGSTSATSNAVGPVWGTYSTSISETSASALTASAGLAGTRTVAESSSSSMTVVAGASGVKTVAATSTSALSVVSNLAGVRTATFQSASSDNAVAIGPASVVVTSLSAMSESAPLTGSRTLTEVSLSACDYAAGFQTAFVSDSSASSMTVANSVALGAIVTETSLSIAAVTSQGNKTALVNEISISSLAVSRTAATRATVQLTSTSSLSVVVSLRQKGFQLRLRERAPLKLSVVVKTPSGYRARWADDSPDPRYAPSGLGFSTAMPGGFEQGKCTLTRDPRLSYPDLEELSTMTVYAAGKKVVGQFRLEQLPDQSGDQMNVGPGAVGWQAHLDDDNSARFLGVDQDISQWQGPSVQRQIQWSPTVANGPSVGPDFTTGFPSLVEELSGAWTENQVVEAWYDAHGLNIGRIYAAMETNGVFVLTGGNAFGAAMFLCNDDTGTAYDQLNPLIVSGAYTLAASQARKWALLQFWNDTVPGGKDGVNFDLFWTALGVYGDHGLPLYGAAGQNAAQGLLASDAIAYALNKWCPKIGYTTGAGGTIQPSSFVIPHLVFLDPVKTSDMVKEAVKYELLDWAVWEGPSFYLNPRGARGKKWRARTGPAQLQQAGPQIDRLWNGVIVQWSDVTGVNRTVGPSDSAANYVDGTLRDNDPLNPINQAGMKRYALVTLGTSTLAGATQVGRLFLQEQKLLATAGQATLTGHVEDDAGVLWPVSYVRAGDQISFTDASDTGYRRIVHTDYSHETFQNSIQLDQPPDSLQAILDRLSVALSPYGMS